MTMLLDQFKRTIDPLGEGLAGSDFLCLGYPMTEGIAFPFAGGGVLLQRRRLYPAVGPWSYCGFARPNESTIQNMQGFDHGANTAFQYRAATVLGNGFVSPFSEPVRVDFDATGALIAPAMPAFPKGVTARPILGGKFAVTFEYDPFGQGAYPTDFAVFAGAAAGSVDYNTPLVDSVTGLAYVLYRSGRRRFAFTTAAFSHGTVKVFAARARNAAGVAERNTLTSEARSARTTTASLAAMGGALQRRVG